MSVVPLQPFPRNEFETRVMAVREGMKSFGIDLLILTSPDNVFYLTGYQTQGMVASLFLCLPSNGSPLFLTRQLDMGNLLAVLDVAPIESYAGYDDVSSPIDSLIGLFRDHSVDATAIGIEKRSLYLKVSDYERLQENFPLAKFIDASGLVEQLRLIKSPLEIQYHRRAASIVVAAMRVAVGSVSVGVCDGTVAASALSALANLGGEWIANWPYIRVGPQTSRGHAMWENIPIEPAQPVNIELAGVVARYHTPLYRTVVCQPTKEQRLISQALKEANEAGVRTVRPDNAAGDVYGAIEDVIHSHGFDDLLHFQLPRNEGEPQGASRSGYTVGIAFAPNWVQNLGIDIVRGSKEILRPGMVFHMPTWLVRPNEFAMGQSSTVVVTDTGSENLTDSMERGPILLD